MRTPARYRAETKYTESTEKKANTNLPLMARVGDGGGVGAVVGRDNFYWVRMYNDPNRVTQCYSVLPLANNDWIYMAKARDRNLTYYEFVAFIQLAGGGTGPPVQVHDHSAVAQGGNTIDLNGGVDNLILDADQDTTISAPVDDQIDFEIAGADDFTMTANAFNVLAGSSIVMADDTWIGLGAAAGRLVFDVTPAPDQVVLTAADLNMSGNDIIIPDAQADALHIIDDTTAIEFQRFVTTAAAQAVVFNNGEADVNFRVATSGLTNALDIDGASGCIGMGIASSSDRHLQVYDAAVSTTVTYYGFRNYHEKTAGVTDAADHLYGEQSIMRFNQAGGIIGNFIGAELALWLTAGTATNAYGGSYIVDLDGGTVTTVYGLSANVDIEGAATVGGNVYGVYVTVDDDAGAAGSVYMLYLNELTGVDYGIYQNGGAPNVLGGHLYPFNVKTQDLGLGTNEWDDIFYVTNNVGTSRLVRSTRICPVCLTEMSRGTGTTIYRGEVADYAVCFCLNCGNAAVEVLNHLPPEKEIEKHLPPKVILENIRVKSSGRNRSVAIDFRYGDDVLDMEGNIIERAVRNSTRLGEYEFDEFFTMGDKDRLSFLLDLGRREWDSREETRLMEEETKPLRIAAKAKVNAWLGKDLLALPN